MAKTQKVSKIKIKRKRWFPIFAPKFLGQREIGESYLSEPELAKGRVLKISLRDLTKNIKDQNIYVSLRINEAGGNDLQTEAVGYAYMPFFVRKLVRVGTGKVDDSFVLKTADGKDVRLKPLAITVFAVNGSVKTAIRKKLREMLGEEVAKLSFDSLITDLIRYRLQMEFRKKLNKICPVRELIIREIRLEKRRKVKKAKKKEEAEEVAEETPKESEVLATKEKKTEEKAEKAEAAKEAKEASKEAEKETEKSPEGEQGKV